MKFFNKNISRQFGDYIDMPLIEALPAHHQKLMQKLISSESSHIDKLFKKISGNEIFLNHDMLSKMLDKLTLQMSLPLHVLQQDSKHSILDTFIPVDFENSDNWLNMLKILRIWPDNHSKSIFTYLSLAHQYVKQDEFPEFTSQRSVSSKRFWKKSDTEQSSPQILFKFIFEKLKYFHWDLIPHCKRPMDLFELFCAIEDAALEHRLVVFNEHQTGFFRSLNASALIYSAIHAFPYALPDLVAESIKTQDVRVFNPLQCLVEHPDYQPLFGVHPHLKDLNTQSLYLGIFTYLKDMASQYRGFGDNTQLIYNFIHRSDQKELIQSYFQNVTSRLIFIFNRLTTLGFLLRSPLLKGLGYHPFMNSEVPNRISMNTELFLNYFLGLDDTEKFRILEQLKLDSNLHTNPPQLALK